MTRTLRRAAWPLPGLLAVALVAVPTPPATAADPPPIPRAVEYAVAEADAPPTLAPAPRPKTPSLSASAGVLPDAVVQKMSWRAIGPASMGGRVTALAVVESDPATYYVATASGGLLKTTNNGTTFTHLFEKESTVAIGDVAVAPSNPNIVWVGTGENNPRNSVSYGDGVYRSTDAGKTWTNMGLRKTFQIGKIVIHPKDPNTVYVGALGRLYGPNPERGLFKTIDGGKTWTKILYVDDRTGVIDFRMDPFDPETLLVGMWERRRDEFDGFFGQADKWPTPDMYGPATTYGPGGGLFKTADGGQTWTKLTGETAKTGLPTVKLGRIGLDYSRKTRGLVVAIIDTERVGMGRPTLSVYVGLSTEDAKGGGITVTLVADDGPAGKAGLQEDDVITKVDDTKIADYDTFIAYLAAKKPGEVVKMTVRRGGKESVIEVKLAPREAKEKEKDKEKKAEPKGKGPTPKGPPVLGILIKQVEGGVEVEAVTPDGPAAKAGIEKEDVITLVAGKKVTDQASLRAVLASFKPGDKVKVTVVRDAGKKAREVEVTLGAGQARGPGGRPANPLRPFQLSPVVGGQRANAQDQQGKDGFQTGGVFVSRDNGETWTRVNSLNPRPFYFSQIRVDPTDDKVLYVAGDTALWKSTTGGKKFDSAPTRGVHPDHHALWINPKDGRHMLLGCDGGFYVTYDRGANWDHLNVLALGQFYHVAVDTRKPYRVYGGLQDNGSWGGPSHVLRGVGPVNEDWGFLLGGDGFVCRVDPTDPDLVYAESQGGRITRQNLRTGEQAGVGAGPPAKPGEQLRWNWNTPFILSSHNPGIIYTAAQYVFRSVNRGAATRTISPEITRTKQGSATALSESPRNPDIVWAGTDDGYVWVTRDGGQKWENVFEKLKAAGLPGPRWVASIEASKAKDGRCYVVLDAHRSDDDKPYVFVTEDYGQTWQPLVANLPAVGSTRVLREDIVNPELLYLGTEFGIWASVNRGGHWTRLNNNLPTVAVHEVAQPTTASEIVVATHGRSIWILDVASLRQMSPRTEKGAAGEVTRDPLADPVTLFAPAPAVRWKLEGGRESPYSQNVRKFYGTNPDRRAHLEYRLASPAKELSLKVQDVTGKTVWDFRNAPKEAGFHRQLWALNRAGGGSVAVPAGTYRVVLAVDGKEFVQPLTVENDPNADPKAVITLEGEQRSEEEEEREREGWDEEEE